MTVTRYLVLVALLVANVSASAACDPSRIDRWLTALRKTSVERAAEFGYAIDGPETQCDLQLLIGATGDAIPHVRAYAARLLGDSVVSSETIVPALIRLLGDKDDGVQSHAVLALIERGGEAAEALAALARHPAGEMSLSNEVHTADYAIFALSQIGAPAVPAVISALHKNEINVRDARAIFFSMDDSAATAIAMTLKGEPALQRNLLVTVDPDPEDHTACLMLRSYLDDPVTRDSAIIAGRHCTEVASWVAENAVCDDSTFEKMLISAAPKDATRVLRSCGKAGRLPFKNFWTARMASRFVERLGGEDFAAVSRDLSSFVGNGLHSEQPETRRAAVEMLGAFATGNDAEVKKLIPFVTDMNPDVRETAHEALRRLGPQARVAANSLRTILEQKGTDSGIAAETLLAVSAPEDSQSLIIPLLLDRRTRYAALSAAQLWTFKLRPTTADIERLSDTSDPREGFEMAKLLARHGTKAPLVRIASDRQSGYQSGAIKELLLLAPDDEEGKRLRRSVLEDPKRHSDLFLTFRGALSGEDAAFLGAIATLPSRSSLDRDGALRVLRLAGESGRGAAVYLRQYRPDEGEPQEITAISLFAVDPSPETARRVIQSLNQNISSWQYFDQMTVQGALNDIPDARYEYLVPLIGAAHGGRKALLLDAFEKWPIPEEMLPYMLDSASDKDASVRAFSARILKLYSANRDATETLSCLLHDSKREVREAAADAFSGSEKATPEVDAIISDSFARHHADSGAWSAGQRLHEKMSVAALASRGAESSLPPAFPLPPPSPSDYDVIDRRLLGRDQENLETVHARLSDILRRLGYQTQSLLRVPGGFALMTLIERIDEQGKPYKPPDRWTRVRVPPRSLRQYLEMLFAEKPGRFRLFVFIVIPQSYLGEPNGELSEARADSMLRAGGRTLSPTIPDRSFQGEYCHILVYAYDKRPGRRASLVALDPLQLAGHLNGAGITALLTPLH